MERLVSSIPPGNLHALQNLEFWWPPNSSPLQRTLKKYRDIGNSSVSEGGCFCLLPILPVLRLCESVWIPVLLISIPPLMLQHQLFLRQSWFPEHLKNESKSFPGPPVPLHFYLRDMQALHRLPVSICEFALHYKAYQHDGLIKAESLSYIFVLVMDNFDS